MAGRLGREIRPRELRCDACGHRFTERVPQKPHFLAEQDEPVFWTVVSTDGVRCPSCGSSQVGPVEARG